VTVPHPDEPFLLGNREGELVDVRVTPGTQDKEVFLENRGLRGDTLHADGKGMYLEAFQGQGASAQLTATPGCELDLLGPYGMVDEEAVR